MALTSLLALAALAPSQDGALRRYVEAADSSFEWVAATIDGHHALKLTSQTWQGIKWKHDIVRIDPQEPVVQDGAIIEVTGWEPNQKDYDYGKKLADASGMPVYLLFQIPNQPLFGREEDALIAYTIEKFFGGEKADWLLHFPMVKSVKAAMDAIEQSTKRSNMRFVVTGASKRGWTAWLAAGSGDARIAGIAPAVFDNLGFEAQLNKQLADWGSYSPMIRDYTDRGLQAVLDTEKGQDFIQMVDPASYLASMETPVLIVNGTNDPFWTVDALQVYWDRILAPKWVVEVPNGNHGIGNKSLWVPTVGWFARACVTDERLPKVVARMHNFGDTWEVSVKAEPVPQGYKVWSTDAPDLHFENSEWRHDRGSLVSAGDAESTVRVSGRRFRTLNKAVFVELTYEIDGHERRLTTPVYVIKKSAF